MRVKGQAELVGGGDVSAPCGLEVPTCVMSCASLSAEKLKLGTDF